MKVSDLIEKLERIPNKNAEVRVQHVVLLEKSDKVVFNWSKVDDILVPVDGSYDVITLSSEKVVEESL